MIVLCRVQLLLDYPGFPPHTPATPALTVEMDSSEKLNLNNLAGEILNVCLRLDILVGFTTGSKQVPDSWRQQPLQTEPGTPWLSSSRAESPRR